jgi:hypothetical protein
MDMLNKSNVRFGALLAIVFAATISRISLPPILGHIPNFSPINAIALFSGCYFFRRSSALLVTLLSIAVGDLFVNHFITGEWTIYYPGFYWQYISYALIVLIGAFASKKMSAASLAVACLGSSVLFFVVSNLGAWASMAMYPKTMSGLYACYVAAIPFFRNTLFSDLVYSALMFGVFEFAQRKYTSLRLAPEVRG